ncbi:phage/plasmid primase, P4 family [Streptomyces chartreusis]|uniref:phage/plasmid primase, P4 family n=1 Tax=Streptomyces chartreusis TaxID=1969 RepID=UPI003D9132C1
MQIDDLLSRFAEVREHADGGFLAVCPAHSDSHPSLRIWVGEDRKVRTTCRAGCTFIQIVRAAELAPGDFFDVEGDAPTVSTERPEIVGPKHIAALAGYVDQTRALLADDDNVSLAAKDYLIDRFGMYEDQAYALGIGADHGKVNPYWPALSPAYKRFARLTVPLKGFDGVARGLQGRDLTGECPGRWLSLTNPDGFRWAPYGVFRGDGGYGVTLVTEGPGDGLTAVAVGYNVVMVRGAALASSPELLAEIAEGVRGTQVIACGDVDNSGQEFNRKLAEGLKPFGIEVYGLSIPKLGPKTDLTEWREHNPSSFAGYLHSAVKAVTPVVKAEVAQQAAVTAELAEATGADVVSSAQGAEAGRLLAELMSRYGSTDAMRAHALVAWTDGRIKYAPGLGYYVWTGRVWERSEVKVRQEIHRMGAALVLAGKEEQARLFLSTRDIDNLMTELRSVPSVYVAPQDFDNRPDLLSFANGVVELRTETLREHRKEDMLTYSLAIEYDADAQCPRWDAFLTEIFPDDPELVPYMQRLCGYGITGFTDEQCFGVLWGKGANGKSVLTDTLSEVFGAINKTTPFATFEEKSGGGIPNDIAALRGARLVMASEGESGKPMSEAVLKRVTGKDMVSARFLRQEFFEFRPSFLLLLATNHKPKFRGQDEGLWRRVKMIPFRRYFAPHERDYSLDAKLRAEAQGIARWAVRGARIWFENGLQDPASISQATQEYRETSDQLAGFFPGVIEEAPGDQVLGAAVYTAYREWCEAEGLPSKEIWTRKALYSALEERKVTSKRVAKGMALVGIRLVGSDVKPTGPGIFGADQ